MNEPRRRLRVDLAFVLCLLAVCVSARSAEADDAEAVKWLKANAVPVRTLDSGGPDQEAPDFADLQALKAHIGDARIVGLGEQTHADGATFKAKCRLIQFLHQEMGFDLIAFESGLYDCRQAWAAFQKEAVDPLAAAGEGVFGIWTRSAQVAPLFRYIAAQAKGDRPLELCGFDCQLTGRASAGMGEDLRKFMKTLGIEEGAPLEAASVLFAALVDHDIKPPERARREGREALEEIQATLQRIAGKGHERDLLFWRQVITSTIAQLDVRWPPKSFAGPEATNLRDAQMARNLIWLAETFCPKRKVILWAASFHLLRDAPGVERRAGGDYRKTVPMGHAVHQHFKDDYYSIAFGAYEGFAGRPWQAAPWDIGEAPKGSIEALCVEAGLENAFIPLRGLAGTGAWLLDKQVARPLGNAPMRAIWPDHFDGYFFTKTMTPSTGADDAPPAPTATAESKPLLPDIEAQWVTIAQGVAQKNRWVDKWDLVNKFDAWRAATAPAPEDIGTEMRAVEAWGKRLMKEDGFAWRFHHLLGAMAHAAGQSKVAVAHYERALDAYPEKDYDRPSAQSKFQHIVNVCALDIMQDRNALAATKFIAKRLERDARFRYFYAQPVVEAMAAAGKSKDVKALYKSVEKAYKRRRKRFPEFKDEIDGFLQELR